MKFYNIRKTLAVPWYWRLLFFVLAGVLCGLVTFVLYISNFVSYLADSPQTCMNCHIMGPQYATWYHSSHRETATCVDCHVPHDNIFHTYYFKAMDGLRHATIFTLRTEPQAIKIRQAGIEAVQANCQRCHEEIFTHAGVMNEHMGNTNYGKGRKCWDCHRETPHGKVRSLASAPYARVPTTKSITPSWMDDLLKREQKEIR